MDMLDWPAKCPSMGDTATNAVKKAVTKTAVAAREGTRLEARDWTRAALALLSEQSIDGVRVEPLAKILGVTKGSFYWHFKDRDALLDAMLSDWRQRATVSIIERLDTVDGGPRERLVRLLRLPLAGGASIWGADVELSIRLWGRRDARAKAALEEVDRLRLLYISGLLQACGVAQESANARAILAYSYIRVAATLIEGEAAALRLRCEEILLASESAKSAALA